MPATPSGHVVFPQRTVGFLARSARPVAPAGTGEMECTDYRAVFAGDTRERNCQHILLPGLLVPAPLRAARSQRRSASDAPFRCGRLRGDRLGQRRLGRRPHRRLHPVRLRHHRPRPKGRREVEVVVRADDDPQDLAKPRGKQDWQLEPHSIWYPRTTGIWQTVWLEIVPRTALQRIAFTPNLARWEIGVEAWVAGEPRDPLCDLGDTAPAATRCSRPTPILWSRARCTAASRCRTRASTIRATSCCGVRMRQT